MYENLLEQLRVAVESGDPVRKELRTFILNNYTGSKVLEQVNQIYGIKPQVKKTRSRVLVFTAEDFEPKKKAALPTPSISVVAEDESDGYANIWKTILEKSDDELKLKFGKDIRTAINFLNNFRKEAGLELIDEDKFKGFSPRFWETFRSTLSLKLTKK